MLTSGVAALALVGAVVSVFYNLKLHKAHEHTQAVLEELGLSAAEVQGLRREGAI